MLEVMSGDAHNTYTGVDVLETLQEAVNYNRYLASLVVKRSSFDDQLIDFGAGTGTFASLVESQNRTVTCIELDENLRTHLSAAGHKTYESIDLVDSSSADLIYSFNVLEHIENDLEAVQGLFHALKPGGTLVLYVPAFEILMSSFDRRVGHLRRYRLSNLRTIVRQAGFDIVDARYADSLGFLAGLAYKLLDNGRGELNPQSVSIYDKIIFPLSRAFDILMHPFVGKNLLVVGRRPPHKD